MMIPPFDERGNLPPGIHFASWEEFAGQFGSTSHRQHLLTGLRSALASLRKAGCRTVYVDGSFVTTKERPEDFDACWDLRGVITSQLDPVLLDFTSHRAAQKAKYYGELFPAQYLADEFGQTFLEFFQIGPDGYRKGMIELDLRGLDED